MSASLTPHEYLFTVDEYYRMLDAGIFTEDDRVELIEGKIITMSPIGSRHAGSVNKLAARLTSQLGSAAVVAVQNPIHLSDQSEPQPDIAVLRPRDDFYSASHPEAADIFLLIEVGDTSTLFDRNVKIPLYLNAGIAEAWLVDLSNNVVQIHTSSQVTSFAPGQTVQSTVLPDLRIPAADILIG
jgi:Uma2 family endonuclease